MQKNARTLRFFEKNVCPTINLRFFWLAWGCSCRSLLVESLSAQKRVRAGCGESRSEKTTITHVKVSFVTDTDPRLYLHVNPPSETLTSRWKFLFQMSNRSNSRYLEYCHQCLAVFQRRRRRPKRVLQRRLKPAGADLQTSGGEVNLVIRLHVTGTDPRK